MVNPIRESMMTKPKAPEGWRELKEFEIARLKITDKLTEELNRLAEIFESNSSLSAVGSVQKAIARLNKATGINNPKTKQTQAGSESFDWDELVHLLLQRGIKSKRDGVTKSEMEELYFNNSHTKFEHNKWNNKEQKESVLAYDPKASNKLRRYWLKRR